MSTKRENTTAVRGSVARGQAFRNEKLRPGARVPVSWLSDGSTLGLSLPVPPEAVACSFDEQRRTWVRAGIRLAGTALDGSHQFSLSMRGRSGGKTTSQVLLLAPAFLPAALLGGLVAIRKSAARSLRGTGHSAAKLLVRPEGETATLLVDVPATTAYRTGGVTVPLPAAGRAGNLLPTWMNGAYAAVGGYLLHHDLLDGGLRPPVAAAMTATAGSRPRN